MGTQGIGRSVLGNSLSWCTESTVAKWVLRLLPCHVDGGTAHLFRDSYNCPNQVTCICRHRLQQQPDRTMYICGLLSLLRHAYCPPALSAAGNILFDEFDNLKLCDFGLAVDLNAEEANSCAGAYMGLGPRMPCWWLVMAQSWSAVQLYGAPGVISTASTSQPLPKAPNTVLSVRLLTQWLCSTPSYIPKHTGPPSG